MHFGQAGLILEPLNCCSTILIHQLVTQTSDPTNNKFDAKLYVNAYVCITVVYTDI